MRATSPPQEPNTFTGRIAAYFTAYPGEWISAATLQRIGGSCAWRTRVADARRAPHFLRIENRCRRGRNDRGETFTLSEYRYAPHEVAEP